MLHEPVRSTNVRSVGYSQAERVLEVAFHSGGVYRYDNVPADVHSALMASPSKGVSWLGSSRVTILTARSRADVQAVHPKPFHRC